jgi:hypothetical protein
MDINMVFMIPAEFCAPMEDVAELMLGAERVVFEKPENPGAHEASLHPGTFGRNTDQTHAH